MTLSSNQNCTADNFNHVISNECSSVIGFKEKTVDVEEFKAAEIPREFCNVLVNKWSEVSAAVVSFVM